MSIHTSASGEEEKNLDGGAGASALDESGKMRWPLFHELPGGLLPREVDLSQVRRVLDVGPEVGEWTLEMARCYPQLQIVRVHTPAYPGASERWGELKAGCENVSCMQGEDVQQLEGLFAPASFDLVSMHFCAGTFAFWQLFPLIEALVPFCREEGYVVWLESDLPFGGDDEAYERLAWLLLRMLRDMGYIHFYSRIPMVSMGGWMNCWLREAGCTVRDYDHFNANVSSGAPLHDVFVELARWQGSRLRSFLLETEAALPKVVDGALAQALQGMEADDFFSVCPLERFVAVRRPCSKR